jgi:glucose-6-phosphate 1-dehydrogenase
VEDCLVRTIEATLDQLEIVCAETPAGPVSLVVFGASGDLAHRKLYPSLYELFRKDLLAGGFYLVGCGRTEYSDERFRDSVRESLNTANVEEPDKFAEFLRHFHYVSGSYEEFELYHHLEQKLMTLDEKYHLGGCRIIYLSIPPFLYHVVSDKLSHSHLSCPDTAGRVQDVRLIVEKPFGRDLKSAKELNVQIQNCFDESRIYRIDHYLGKETVQNLLVFRFANSIFEPLWSRDFIEHVQITIAESVGVEHRAGYYDRTGALRDMFQNHMLQMVSLVAMEPPATFEANSVRDEKAKLLRCIRPFSADNIDQLILTGQYGPGEINGDVLPGYMEEEGVADNSQTETFIAAKLTIDNWRWKGVPFYLRTGKRMARKLTEIVITFKQVPHSMFASAGLDQLKGNRLRFQIQPEEGMFLSLQAKRPGSKLCMDGLELAVDYQKVFKTRMPEAYQRLLLDCMTGDQMLFMRQDSVLLSWQLMQPVLDYWEQQNKKLFIYPAGILNIKHADEWIKKDGIEWRPL